MEEYKYTNITRMVSRREIGLPLKDKSTAVKKPRKNSRCDHEVVKSLLCDRQVYLEVIACRKVSRAAEPSVCHNRLFTNNYHSWFNLCTSPTSGPHLMKSNVFSDAGNLGIHQENVSDGIKILDAVALHPPNGCLPLPNSQHRPCILLLAKSGWLYQFCLDDASLLNKVYLSTDSFADEFIHDSEKSSGLSSDSNTVAHRRLIADARFNYRYASIVDGNGKVIIKSTTVQRDGCTLTAHIVFSLFPLRFESHFVTLAAKQDLKAEFWTDIFVVTSRKGSTVALYGFKDIQKLHSIQSPPIHLRGNLTCKDLMGMTVNLAIGSAEVGFPYTLGPIDLEEWEEWSRLQLFKTKAQRSICRIGGIPYHYAIPVDKLCTAWSLRGLADQKELTRFHVDEKWDNSHISGLDFHTDESGRILMINKGIVTLFSIAKVRFDGRGGSSETKLPKNQKRFKCGRPSNSPQKEVQSSPSPDGKLLKTYPVSDVDYHLRIVGSPIKKLPLENRAKCRIVKCFEIDVSKSNPWKPQAEHGDTESQDGSLNWAYPQTSPRTYSSSGRLLKEPSRFCMNTRNPATISVVGVTYEDDMDVLAVLHYGSPSIPFRTAMESCADLLLSLYDNLTGQRMNCVVVEQDLVPHDESEVSVILDEDTVIYTRVETDNILNYKIMRFCRKP